MCVCVFLIRGAPKWYSGSQKYFSAHQTRCPNARAWEHRAELRLPGPHPETSLAKDQTSPNSVLCPGWKAAVSKQREYFLLPGKIEAFHLVGLTAHAIKVCLKSYQGNFKIPRETIRAVKQFPVGSAQVAHVSAQQAQFVAAGNIGSGSLASPGNG